MPEIAEVKLTVDFLNDYLLNKKIIDWVFTGGHYTDNYPDGFNEFDDALPLIVNEISCKGKFIYFILHSVKNPDKKYYIMHSLMLTGSWRKIYDDCAKWFIEIKENDEVKTLWFRDTRGFATLKFTTNKQILDDKLKSLGPDIMSEEFTLPCFKKLVKQHAGKNITSFLMDQSIISGVGNYIKAETLFSSKISPLRKTGSLNEREIELLYEGLVVIPRISYNKQGLSLRDYKDADGVIGDYDKELKIYGKKNATRTKTSDGRITYWDKDVQV